MSRPSNRLDEARTLYARMMAAASGRPIPGWSGSSSWCRARPSCRPGPWHVMVEHRLVETPSADPALLYQNALVVLDRQKGINNGEPFLHAGWIGAVAPRPGETVTQVGAGGGYYTAILSMLVLPDGKVVGLRNRRGAGGSRAAKPGAIRERDASSTENAVTARAAAFRHHLRQCRRRCAAAAWLKALKPGGRLVFPWRPATRASALPSWPRGSRADLRLRILGGAWFIPCSGASDEAITLRQPSTREARRVTVDRPRAPSASPTPRRSRSIPTSGSPRRRPAKDAADHG